MNISIEPYTTADNDAALRLEGQCIQGSSLALRFHRPTFHARSEVYDSYQIWCAKDGNRVVGTLAAAIKSLRLHHDWITAAYLYDLRVHPNYRSQRIGSRLYETFLNEKAQDVQCEYILIGGGNQRALTVAYHKFQPQIVIPLTYLIIPVYRQFAVRGNYSSASASCIHEQYLSQNPKLEFVPHFQAGNYLGWVDSILSVDSASCGCSVWTNENLLAEEVVRLPIPMQALRIAAKILNPLIKLPVLPAAHQNILSWFLFDFFSENDHEHAELLREVNNRALRAGKQFLYILLQNTNPLLSRLRKSGSKIFTIPYLLLAKGENIPDKNDMIYLDVRDL